MTDTGNIKGAPQIEVTPFMIEVGAWVLAEWAEACPPDSLAEKVYRAMREAEMAQSVPEADPRPAANNRCNELVQSASGRFGVTAY